MDAWRFTTDSHPGHERQGAWREAMARLRLPVGEGPFEEPFHADVSALTSPLGMEFAVVSGTRREISGVNADQPAAIWLMVLLEGYATLMAGEASWVIRPGDIMYGPTGLAATLRLETRFRVLFVNVPRMVLDQRLIAPRSLGIGVLPALSGVGHVFSGLLRATAETLDDLTGDQLRPVELALTEFLAASLAAAGSPAARGGAAGAREAHLNRVRQTIETLLAEPDLTLARVAREEGVSPRYLQKLFAVGGPSFTHYIRLRRLERCRLDLTSPRCADLSISEISFRWGFNGSAHFSRAFREQYGLSPREYRRQASAASISARVGMEGPAP
jgi:AraC-like DNA-binding protein